MHCAVHRLSVVALTMDQPRAIPCGKINGGAGVEDFGSIWFPADSCMPPKPPFGECYA